MSTSPNIDHIIFSILKSTYFESQNIINLDMSLIGKKAPDFTSKAWIDDQFQEVSLKHFLGKYVLLFFYPLDFSFVCPTEIIAFNNLLKSFRKLDCEVIGCSVDS